MSTKKIKRILIVKDNPSNVKLFSDILQLHGYQVIEYQNVGHHFSITYHYKPDLILLEIQQLESLNFELACQLKKEQELRIIPLVAISLLSLPSQPAQKIEAYERVFDRYLINPFSIPTFLNMVDSTFKQQSTH